MFSTGAHCNVALAEFGFLAAFSVIFLNSRRRKNDCWVFINDAIIVFWSHVILLFCIWFQILRADSQEDWLLATHRWPTVKLVFQYKLTRGRHLNVRIKM